MSTRNNSGSHYENHQRAAELRDVAAHAHRAGAEHRGQQAHLTAQEQSAREREHGEQAFRQAADVRSEHSAGVSSSSQEEIAARAYTLWEARGRPQGSPENDWFTAVEQLRSGPD